MKIIQGQGVSKGIEQGTIYFYHRAAAQVEFERTALQGIEATEAYFKRIGMPVRLSELGIDDTKFDEMAEKCTFFGKRVLKDYIPLDKKEMIDIYRLAL